MRGNGIIDVDNIKDYQKLTIENGLNTYLYLKKKYENNEMDEGFRAVFTDFYLKSQGVMRREENQKSFFKILERCDKNNNLAEIVIDMKEKLTVDMYEFSFATKLYHTVDNDSPIWDKKVRDYLKNAHQIAFKQYKKDDDKIEIIKYNWGKLKEWYKSFVSSDEGKKWIAWFDEKFPEGSKISDVKKIDFIIFACN